MVEVVVGRFYCRLGTVLGPKLSRHVSTILYLLYPRFSQKKNLPHAAQAQGAGLKRCSCAQSRRLLHDYWILCISEALFRLWTMCQRRSLGRRRCVPRKPEFWICRYSRSLYEASKRVTMEFWMWIQNASMNGREVAGHGGGVMIPAIVDVVAMATRVTIHSQ